MQRKGSLINVKKSRLLGDSEARIIGSMGGLSSLVQVPGEHLIFFTDMVDPPFFKKSQKFLRVLIPNAVLAGVGQGLRQFLVQRPMLFQIGVAAFFKKILFNLEMDAGVFVNHADHGLEHLIAMLVLYRETEGVDGGNNPLVLFVDNRYPQIIRGLPYNKDIVIQQTLPSLSLGCSIGHVSSDTFKINFLLSPVNPALIDNEIYDPRVAANKCDSLHIETGRGVRITRVKGKKFFVIRV
jgi:hypothetical protein